MKDRRVLPNGEIEEWERGKSTPDDFIYDPETDAYYAPGEPADLSGGETFEEFCEKIRKIREEMRNNPGPHLITADEVRAWKAAATASPVQKSRRKPKAQPNDRQRDLFADLRNDDDAANGEEPSAVDSE